MKIKQRKQEKEPVILLRDMKVFLTGEDKLRETKKSESAKREMSIQSSENDLNARKGD